MTNHTFSFAGGDILSQIGATWFVSFSYFIYVDDEHENWTQCSSSESRRSKYYASEKYHVYWLNEVLCMNDKNLNKNKLGLKAEDVKRMARMVLEKLQENK